MKNSPRALKLLIFAGVALLWLGSLLAVYSHTREKWRLIGVEAGEINGKAHVLGLLCRFARPGPLDVEAEGKLEVKATVATLRRRGKLLEVRCQ